MSEAKEKPGSLFNKLPRQQAWQLLAFAVFNGASVAGIEPSPGGWVMSHDAQF